MGGRFAPQEEATGRAWEGFAALREGKSPSERRLGGLAGLLGRFSEDMEGVSGWEFACSCRC